MISRRQVTLLSVLSVAMAGENLFNIGIIWTVVSKGGSTAKLGVVLALAAAVPYLVQQVVPGIQRRVSLYPEEAFKISRFGGILIGLLAVLFVRTDSSPVLYTLVSLFSVGSFVSAQAIEVLMTSNVRHRKLSSATAARVLQTATQVGAFGGAAIAGLVLDVGGGMTSILSANIAAMAISVLGISVFKSDSNIEIADASSTVNEIINTELVHPRGGTISRWSASSALLLIAIQIAGFNFLVPIIANRVLRWNASEFGLIDACAGLASLAAVVATSRGALGRWSWLFACIFIGILNFTFAYAGAISLVIPAVLFGGFFITALRICQYSMLYGAYEDSHQAARWSLHLVFGQTLIKAVIPLLLGGFLLFVSEPALFLGLGSCFIAGIGGIQLLRVCGMERRQQLRSGPPASDYSP